jgi:5-methylcytosine-specific restriction endonuclease McrA
MADKHSPLLRTQVEVAAACGAAERKITAAFGVARTTQYRWLKADGKERAEAYRRRWEKKNPEAKAQWNKRWRDANPGVKLEYNRQYSRNHYAQNPEYYAAKADRRRRGAKEWPCSEIEKLMIKHRYQDARRLTEETGIKHEVDHIWPLSKGGPHLPWNLQVLTKQENRTKGANL